MSCGVYRIYNLKTDMTYLGVSDDVENVAAKERFSLDLGMHPCSSLQDDYTKTGLELFVIEIMATCPQDGLETCRDGIRMRLESTGCRFYPL